MFKKIAVLVVVIFFAAGAVAAMAGDKAGCDGKSGWQGVR